jgi:hypothetical protein
MGKLRGRLCLLHQIDFDTDTLLYDVHNKLGESASGEINSVDELMTSISEILSIHKTDDVEIALKFIKLKNSRLSGLCIKSFPRTLLTNMLFNRLSLCLGGENNTDLVHLPDAGTILDQSNIFIQAFNIYRDEKNKYSFQTQKKAKK